MGVPRKGDKTELISELFGADQKIILNLLDSLPSKIQVGSGFMGSQTYNLVIKKLNSQFADYWCVCYERVIGDDQMALEDVYFNETNLAEALNNLSNWLESYKESQQQNG